MADRTPQNHDKSQSNLPASAPPQDYYSVLMKVINDVTNDHALLRKLVYALAWQNLRPEVIVTRPIPEAQSQAKTISELGQALELEKAIERVEAEAIGQGPDQAPRQISRPRAFDDAERAQPAAPKPAPAPAPAPVDDFNPAALATLLSETPPAKVSEPPAAREPEPVIGAVQDADTSFELPHSSGAIVPLPDPQARPERKDVVTLERIPAWLDPNVRVSLDSVEYAPIRQPYQGRSNLASFAQLIAASVIGVVLYIGISGWVYLGLNPATVPSHPVGHPLPGHAAAPPPPPPAQQQQAAAREPNNQQVANRQQPVAAPPPEPQPILPFPLPRAYGVYAGVPGQLFELEALPIKVPDPRVQASAEITKPSRPPIPGENLTFVVFRRDLVNAAPQTVAVRVVARVQRTTKYVNGKPAVVPVEGVWRVRAKSYEFRVSPLEGRNEMVVIQPNPGFVFPPGRYALVLNGFGYDFTVTGAITAPEQCLEQVEVVNGAVLSECPKA